MKKEKQIGDIIKYWVDTVKPGEEETGSKLNMVECRSKIETITPYFYYLEDGTKIPRKL